MRIILYSFKTKNFYEPIKLIIGAIMHLPILENADWNIWDNNCIYLIWNKKDNLHDHANLLIKTNDKNLVFKTLTFLCKKNNYYSIPTNYLWLAVYERKYEYLHKILVHINYVSSKLALCSKEKWLPIQDLLLTQNINIVPPLIYIALHGYNYQHNYIKHFSIMQKIINWK